jgi:hypothetical protein
VIETPSDWEDRLARWQNELELFEQLDETPWITLAKAEAETGVPARPYGPGTATARSSPGWWTARTGRSAWSSWTR